MNTPAVPEITPRALKNRLDRGDKLRILDVRTVQEHEAASIGGYNIPVEELEGRMPEIEGWRDDEIVVHCRLGGRSAKAVQMLQQRGFSKVLNMKGGLNAWTDEVDPSLPKV